MLTDKQILKKHRSSACDLLYKEKFTWKGMAVDPDYKEAYYKIKFKRCSTSKKFYFDPNSKELEELDRIIKVLSTDLEDFKFFVSRYNPYGTPLIVNHKPKRVNFHAPFYQIFSHYTSPIRYLYVGGWMAWGEDRSYNQSAAQIEEMKTIVNDALGEFK
jgi:hypothetical protein